jgi:hypothetical protein
MINLNILFTNSMSGTFFRNQELDNFLRRIGTPVYRRPTPRTVVPVVRTVVPVVNPNYSKASGAVKKWLAVRPHTVHQNVVHIKLPANATDPVGLHNFAPGNEAVMVIKKRLQQNGAMRSKRIFYTKNSIGGMAAIHRGIASPHRNPVPWRTILRMKGSDIVFKDPINRRAVYRRDLMNVKFVA